MWYEVVWSGMAARPAGGMGATMREGDSLARRGGLSGSCRHFNTGAGKAVALRTLFAFHALKSFVLVPEGLENEGTEGIPVASLPPPPGGRRLPRAGARKGRLNAWATSLQPVPISSFVTPSRDQTHPALRSDSGSGRTAAPSPARACGTWRGNRDRPGARAGGRAGACRRRGAG